MTETEYSKYFTIDIDALIEKIVADTDAWNKETFIETTEGTLSEKGKKLVDIAMNSETMDDFLDDFLDDDDLGFGCRTRKVMELLEVLIDEKLLVKQGVSTQVVFKNGIVVVPIVNMDSHNYPLDKPTLIIDYDDSEGLRLKNTQGKNATRGNSLPKSKRCYRPATREDILTFISECDRNQLILHMM